MRFVREPAETEEWGQKYRILKPEMIYISGGVLRVRGGNRVATPSPSLSVWRASSTAARGVPDWTQLSDWRIFMYFTYCRWALLHRKVRKQNVVLGAVWLTTAVRWLGHGHCLPSLPLQVLTAALDLHVTADRNIQNPQTSRRFDAVSAYIVVISVYCERRTTWSSVQRM